MTPWGSITAATLWLAAGALFAFYVTNFAGYAQNLRRREASAVWLMWFFIASVIVVLGGRDQRRDGAANGQRYNDTRGCSFG